MSNLVNQPSAMPTRKVTWMTFATVAASIAADVIVGFLPAEMPVDPSELEWVFVAIITFATGYFVRERAA